MSALVATLDDLVEQKNATKLDYKVKVLKASGFDNGEIKSKFKGRGLELEEVREYVFGDDIRDIDWRVSARKNEPYTKIYSVERDVETYIFLDLSASMIFGTQTELKSVTACKMAALLGWLALENKDKLGMIIFDGKQNYVFKPRGGIKQFMAILKQVSELSESILQNTADEVSIEDSLSLLQQYIKSDGVCFIVSDFAWFNENTEAKLLAILKKSNTSLIKIADVLERYAPPTGNYLAEYANEKILISSNKTYQNKYQEYFMAKEQKLKEFCNFYGGRLFTS
ncbi:MAG: DUF58 domain-containing protein [Alphaproteobacteria bacterium]